MPNGVFKSCWCFHIGLYFKKPCPIYIILVYTTFPPYFILPCDVQLYLPQIIPSCAYFPYHTSSYHHTGPGILYVFEGTSKPVLFCIYKSLLTHIPFMDAALRYDYFPWLKQDRNIFKYEFCTRVLAQLKEFGPQLSAGRMQCIQVLRIDCDKKLPWSI